VEGGEILFTIATEQLHISKSLRAPVFDGEAPVSVLNVVSGGYDVVSDFKKGTVVAAIGAFEKVGNGGLKSGH
jgi:hypothetical protein